MLKTWVVSIAVVALSTRAATAGDFFPVQPGNTWVYRADRGRSSLTIQVGLTPILHDGQVYYKLTGYTPKPLFVRRDESGSLYYLDVDTEREGVLTLFEASDAFWFTAPERECEQDGQAQTKRTRYDGVAGSYGAVLPVKYRSYGCADTGVEEELFAENIGMIRRVVGSIAGPVAYELVQAKVGAVSVAERPNTAFRLGLREAGAGSMLATLRLSMDEAMTLTFPTSQEFDLALRDEGGKEIWRWSAGKFFNPVVTRKAGREFVWETEIPLEINGQPLAPGSYTLEGWLTITSGERTFAAATALSIYGDAAGATRISESRPGAAAPGLPGGRQATPSALAAFRTSAGLTHSSAP